MPVKIKSTSGSVTLDAQNVSGDQTLTVPSLSGGKTLLTTDGDGSSLTGIVHGVDGITSASSSGTAINIASDNKVGVGTATPLKNLQVGNFSGGAEIELASSTSTNGSILFGDGNSGTDVYRGYIQYQHASDKMLFATTATDRLIIDSSGRVTMPNLPCFRAYDTTTNSFTANTDFAFASTDFNNGSHYNTSNGKFTAPVAGYYTFSACFGTSGWSSGNTTQDLFTIRHNNSAICYSIKRENTDSANSANGFFTDYANMIVYLAASDYVTVHAAYSSSNFKNRNYTWFCGALLG